MTDAELLEHPWVKHQGYSLETLRVDLAYGNALDAMTAMVQSWEQPRPTQTPATDCQCCNHPLDKHQQVNDHTDCTEIYVDPVTGEETFCECSRGCCLPERCPGRSASHECCCCLDA